LLTIPFSAAGIYTTWSDMETAGVIRVQTIGYGYAIEMERRKVVG
jgi:hypothetical protein